MRPPVACAVRFATASIAFLLTTAPVLLSAAGPGVHGRVFGHDEQGNFLGVVAGAEISFQNRSKQPVAKTTSDDKGYYKVDLPPGEYLYEIHADGYRDEDAGRGMRLQLNEGYSIFNLVLTKGEEEKETTTEIPARQIGTLHGRVLERTPEGLSGIPGARISLRREGSNELVSVTSRNTTADGRAMGSYEVTLESGIYRASVIATGFELFTDPNPIEIPADGNAERDFVFSRSAPPESATGQGIRGVVTLVDSVTAATAPPIEIEIQALCSGRGEPIRVEPVGGSYSQDLPPGRYRVTARAQGFPQKSSPPVYVFVGRYTEVNLVLQAKPVPLPQTSLEVFVFTRVTQQAQPVPLADADVSLLKSGADPENALGGRTDATGHVIFQLPEGGEYTAEAHHTGFAANRGTGTVAIGESHEVAIELSKEETPAASELTLTVVVTDADTNKPLSEAKLFARHREGTLADSARGSTGSNGEVVLKLKRPGTYTVLAQLFGYSPEGTTTEVAAGTAKRVSVSLRKIRQPVEETEEPPQEGEKPFQVTGFVAYRDSAGQLRGVPGSKIVWERVSAHPAPNFVSSKSDGSYGIELIRGTYQVRVVPPAGFEELLEQVEVNPSISPKYFIVRSHSRPVEPPTGLVSVQGSVVESIASREVGIPQAEILFTRTDGVSAAESGQNGGFGVRLQEGTYRVLVRAKGFSPLDTSAMVRPGSSPLKFVLKRLVEPSLGFALRLSVVESTGRVPGQFAPVSDAQVRISFNGHSMSGVTNRSGTHMVRVKPETYHIHVEKSGYVAASLDVPVSDRDVSRQIVLARDERPQPGGKHSFTVHVTERTVGTLAERIISGAKVEIIAGDLAVASGTTDGRGNFSAVLPPRLYRVRVSASGYTPGGASVTLASSDVTLPVRLVRSGGTDLEDRRGRLLVRVVERVVGTQSEKPLSGVQLVVMRGNQQVAAGSTDGSGSFSTVLPIGDYAVKASARGYAPAGQTTTVSESGASLTFRISRVGGDSTDEPQKPLLSVRVTRPRLQPSARIQSSGLPFAGAQVTVMSGANRVASGVTDQSGIYSVRLAPGTYSVKIFAQGFAPAGKIASLSGSGTTVSFLLQSTGGDADRIPINRRFSALNQDQTIQPTEQESAETSSTRRLPTQLDQPVSRGGTTLYVIEYRLNEEGGRWQEFGRYPNAQEAQRALINAVNRGRIPRTAETRIVQRTLR